MYLMQTCKVQTLDEDLRCFEFTALEIADNDQKPIKIQAPVAIYLQELSWRHPSICDKTVPF